MPGAKGEHWTGALHWPSRSDHFGNNYPRVVSGGLCRHIRSGAHTHWHTQPKGQGLYVTNGVALVYVEGHAPLRLSRGASIWIDAGQRHWHGAAPEQSMTRVAYQQAANDLSTIAWHEPVSPAAYNHAAEETP